MPLETHIKPNPLASLHLRRVLVVEDEYLQAHEFQVALAEYGALIIGPASTVAEALALVDQMPELDVAVLDVNLDGEIVFPVADELLRRGVPFVFVTGYDREILPYRFANVPTLTKPVTTAAVAAVLVV